MLEQYKEMLKQADMLSEFTESRDTINYMGDQISVIIITVPTNELGDAVEAVFHEGTETLIDMNVKHVCTCGHHH